MLSSTTLVPIIIILPLIRCIHYRIRPKVTGWSNPTPQPTPSPINQSREPRVICCSNLLLRNTFSGSGDHPDRLGTLYYLSVLWPDNTVILVIISVPDIRWTFNFQVFLEIHYFGLLWRWLARYIISPDLRGVRNYLLIPSSPSQPASQPGLADNILPGRTCRQAGPGRAGLGKHKFLTLKASRLKSIRVRPLNY